MRLTYLLIIIVIGLGAGCGSRQENISIGVHNAPDGNSAVIVVNGVPTNVRSAPAKIVTIAGNRREAETGNPAGPANGNIVNAARPVERMPGTDPQSLPKPFPTGSVSTSPPPPKPRVRAQSDEEPANRIKSGQVTNP